MGDKMMVQKKQGIVAWNRKVWGEKMKIECVLRGKELTAKGTGPR